MSQRLHLQATQTQRLQQNIGLHTALKFLKADAAGLTRYLEEIAASNPHLVLDPPPLPAPGEWLQRWRRVLPGLGGVAAEATAGIGASLMAHVMAAIDRRMKTGPERMIALALAEALEPSGWLGRPESLIARDLGVAVAAVAAVLLRLQEIEPIGLFARDLAECLRLQAQEGGTYDAVMAVILARLDLLAAGATGRLARLAGVTEAEVLQRFRLIRAMDPKPGTQFDSLATPQPREPDLILRPRPTGGWDLQLNRSSLPGLRIVEAGAGGAALAAAKAVERMVAARNVTILRVGWEILRRQEAALRGGPAALVPMGMAEVAAALDLHESTISRVVAGTSVDTPHGLWWLRRLFSRAVGAVSAAALRERLARLVAGEPAGAAWSDEVLAAALSRDGAVIARRTVAKYRAMLKIPPAHRRRGLPR